MRLSPDTISSLSSFSGRRVGLRTFIALENKLLVDEMNANAANAAHLETYLHWPDR